MTLGNEAAYRIAQDATLTSWFAFLNMWFASPGKLFPAHSAGFDDWTWIIILQETIKVNFTF
jgi:hypothetical protein